MKAALTRFGTNLRRARDLVAIYSTLSAKTTAALDLSDCLRAALVLGVSAFDNYVHELTRAGMLEIAKGTRPQTDAYLRFSISLKAFHVGQSTSGSLQWLEEEIRIKHGWLSFQEPDKVADAIRLISSKQLWRELDVILKTSSGDAKKRLKSIVERRNKIAHEADMDPSAPGARWPISEADVHDALNSLEQIANAIFTLVQ